MKVRLLPLSILLATLLFSGFTFMDNESQIVVSCAVTNCNKSLDLYKFDGITFTKVHSSIQEEAGVHLFHLEKSEPTFYYLGPSVRQLKPIILGQEEDVVIKGDCGDIRSASIEKSELNQSYDKLKEEIREMSASLSKMIRKYQRARTDEERTVLVEQMKTLDDYKINLLDSLKKSNPFFADILALNGYLTYQNNGDGYESEIDYFAKEYFKFVDFKRENYNKLPWVYESFRSYATTLSSVPITPEQHYTYLETTLNRVPTGTPAYKYAITGYISALKSKNHSNYVPFAELFAKQFQESDPQAVASLMSEIENMKKFSIGGQAPDFTQLTPEGEELSLSDFRGKVLLVDFWASWCGPCRRENPNVVKMYNKYKDQGFEILGVSLDKQKDRWVQAIEKDQLTWPQISDLRGWQNEVAQTYSVTSIPYTLLLDREGKIIAKKLRGPALEQKLEELFN